MNSRKCQHKRVWTFSAVYFSHRRVKGSAAYRRHNGTIYIYSAAGIVCFYMQHINTGVGPYHQKLSLSFQVDIFVDVFDGTSFSSRDICIIFWGRGLRPVLETPSEASDAVFSHWLIRTLSSETLPLPPTVPLGNSRRLTRGQCRSESSHNYLIWIS